MPPHASAMAFDFDGTLIRGGKLNNDKSIHIMYSAWVACHENGLGEFLRPKRLKSDVAEMTRAYIRYPGAPRFQQFAAVVNALVHRRYDAVDSFDGLALAARYREGYERARARFNELYSAINDAAAARYWTPYPSAKKVLKVLGKEHDLFIASGVTQDILEKDFARHRFSRSLFKGIFGGNVKGGDDKGAILKRIKASGYERVLFVADSNKDWEYAQEAGAFFYRICEDADYPKLLRVANGAWGRGRNWSFSLRELRFMKEKTVELLERYHRGGALAPVSVTQTINR